MSNQENDESEQPPAHEAVGYGKPPRQRRFKESGNTKGRPEGRKNRKTIVKAVANEMHSVTENGRRRRLSILQLVLLSLRNMALEGKTVRAFVEFHRLIKAYQLQEAGGGLGYIFLSADVTVEEAIVEGEKANAEARARRTAESRE